MKESKSVSVNVADIMKQIEREASRIRKEAGCQEMVEEKQNCGERSCRVHAMKSRIRQFARVTKTEPILWWAQKHFYRRMPLHRNAAAVSVGELLQYNDLEFIENAYRKVLGREPDAHGLAFYLRGLRGLVLHRIEILHELRSSPEGLNYNAPVTGLKKSYSYYRFTRALSKIPFFGIPFRHLLVYKKVLAYSRYFPSFLGTFLEPVNALKDTLTKDLKELQDTIQHESEMLSMLQDNMREMYGRSLSMDHNLGIAGDMLSGLHSRVTRLDDAISKVDETAGTVGRIAAAANEGISVVNGRVTNIETIIEDIKGEHTLPPELYLELENRFRGSRDEIKERLSIYLTYMERSRAGAQNAPILDVGCGRGEWMELVSEAGLVVHGIDFSPAMVRFCTSLGLAVLHGEAVTHLRGEASNSLGAITCFHVVEHLTPSLLADLLAQVLRTLKPGGVAIFETPNPENLIVGACNFHLDLSHRQPIPPETFCFLLEATGFVELEVLKLHPFESSPPLFEDMSDGVRMLLQGPQDYAVIGYKRI